MNGAHIQSVSNGLGAPSMLLLLMACRRELPAHCAITADTGWENDRTWSNGRKSSALDYYSEIIIPLCEKYAFRAYFEKAENKEKLPLDSLIAHTRMCAVTGKFNNLKIPMYGSRGGRMRQSCTDKWKIRAINQTLRYLGAKTALTFQGIHAGEAWRRVRGTFLEKRGKWTIYQTVIRTKSANKQIKWLTHCYPLVDLGLNRDDIQRLIVSEKIPYLLSSECDGCPHKDLPRWERTSPTVLADLANLESQFNGEFFFTAKRIPLLEAIELMKIESENKESEELDFGCNNTICGV